jgi:predicted nucleotidyltransferase
MTQQEIHKKIRDTVDSHLPGSRLFLFGSRARGDYQRGSDYDLLIITPNHYTDNEKMDWLTLVAKSLIASIKAPFDVFMNDENEVIENQLLPGHIIRSALKEGIAI